MNFWSVRIVTSRGHLVAPEASHDAFNGACDASETWARNASGGGDRVMHVWFHLSLVMHAMTHEIIACEVPVSLRDGIVKTVRAASHETVFSSLA